MKPETRIYSFGVYELDTRTGDLRKDGKEQPRLREQALRILLMLLERPRDLVTREELRERLWASDTFVDFDHGLNSAVNQLRSALGDSAVNSRFIQTVPRRGYRFIAPVEARDMAGIESAAVSQEAAVAQKNAAETNHVQEQAGWHDASAERSLLSESHELPRVSRPVVRMLFGLLQVMYLSFYAISLARLPVVESVLMQSRILPAVTLTVLIISAAAGIPTRLYLLAAAVFDYGGLNEKFQRLFPWILFFDELWALAPFLLVQSIGLGSAIGATAALLYAPFAQRSLVLMGYSTRQSIR